MVTADLAAQDQIKKGMPQSIQCGIPFFVSQGTYQVTHLCGDSSDTSPFFFTGNALLVTVNDTDCGQKFLSVSRLP